MIPLRTLLAAFLFFIAAAATSRADVTLIKGVYPTTDEPTDRVYIHSRTMSESELLALSDELARAGAQRMHVILPDIIVCDLPRGGDADAIILRRGARAYPDTYVDDVSSEGWSISPRTLERQLARAGAPTPTAPKGMSLTEMREVPPRPSAFRSYAGGDRKVFQNSEILSGKILVQIVFPESDANNENWTDSARNTAFASVMASFTELQDEFKNAHITPVYRRVEDAQTSFEPILMSPSAADEKQWVSDVMTHIGYVGMPETYIDLVHQFNNDGRNQYGTDWVFTIFVINAQNDPDHMFENTRNIGWGYLGGPHIVTPFPAGWLGTSMQVLIKREVGHVFWALDEQISSQYACGARSGYLNGDNGNRTTEIDPIAGPLGCRPGVIPDGCIMNSADAYGYLQDSFCEWSSYMLGVSDKDKNNVPDALDSAPRVKFSSAAAETLVGTALYLEFQAVAEPIPNTNSRQPPAERMDYTVPVKDVAVSLQGSPPGYFPPLDGEADELVEDFKVKLPQLTPGLSTIDITTRNIYGAKSLIQKKSIFLIWLDFFNFAIDYEPTGLRVNFFMRGERFDASLVLKRRNVDTGEVDVVDTGLSPTGPTRNEITPYAGFDKTVLPGVKYEYFVEGSFTLLYKGKPTDFEFQSKPVVLIGPFARTDVVSIPSPNPFAGETFVSVTVPKTFQQAGGGSYEVRVATPVAIAVFDVAGRRIKDIFRDSIFENVVTVAWDGTNGRGQRVPVGVYFIRAEAGDNTGVQKVLLVR